MMSKTPKHDNFLADIVAPKAGHGLRLSYWDGFRFGLGFLTAHVLTIVIIGGLAWLIIWSLHLQG